MERDMYELLLELNRNLDRIASALESYNNAAIKGVVPNESDGHVEVFTSTWVKQA